MVFTISIMIVDYEELQPRLDVLLGAFKKDFELATSLEKRVASLMERHAIHVSSSPSSDVHTIRTMGNCDLFIF